MKPSEEAHESRHSLITLCLSTSARIGVRYALEFRQKTPHGNDLTGSNLQSFLDSRADEEVSKIQAVLEELARAIREELRAPKPIQYELEFTDNERDQLRRDNQALEARLAEIPGEIERETAALRARYADPKPHLFPVGVTFLVPHRFDR